MKKNYLVKILTGALLISTVALNSCRDDFDFEEFDNYDDSIAINGKVAAPLINTKMKFSDFKAESINKRLHFTTDNKGLIHMIVDQDDKVIKLPTMLSPEELAALGLPPQSWQKTYVTDKQDLYRDRDNGYILIKNPSFTLKKKVMKNSKINLQINKIEFFKGNGTSMGIVIPENPEFAEEVKVNNENTNGELSEILKQMPDYYILTYTAQSDALDDGDKMKVNVVIDLPLEIKAGGFSVCDTIEADLDEILENADQLIIKSKAQNSLPIDLKIKAYFLGKGSVIVDSIFTQGPWNIEAAKTDAQGNITQTTAADQISTFDKKRLEKLSNAKCDRMIYDIVITTDQTKYVNITESQSLDLRMSMCAEAGFTTKD